MANEKDIQDLLQSALKENLYSGYQLLAVRGGRRLSLCGGMTSHWPDATVIDPTTWFDIGSVTKVIATLSLYVPLFQSGKISLTTKVGELLSKFHALPYANLQVGELFNHCSGLIDWLPYYESEKSAVDDFLIREAKRAVISAPRQKTIYSDLNYWILGEILKAVENDFSAFPERGREWFGMRRTQYGPLPKEKVAATEFCLWRKAICQGIAFDENCFAMGGVGPHAGLFSTAEDLAGFCEQWLKGLAGSSKWISREWAGELTRRQNWISGSSWAIGWDTRSVTGSSAGERFSEKSFGHLGYPGASIWIDPDAQGYAIFLTNRIHPSRFDVRIRGLRPKVHNLVYEFWEQT